MLYRTPQGIRLEAKKKLVANTSAALEETYRFNDTRVFLREYAPENVGQDGQLQTEIRPVCFVEGPQIGADLKKNLVKKINAAVAEAYRGLANVQEIMVLINEYPLENAGADGGLQSENPEIRAALKRANE